MNVAERKAALSLLINRSVSEIDSPKSDQSLMYKYGEQCYWVLTPEESAKYISYRIIGSLCNRRTEDLLVYMKDCPFAIVADVQSFGAEANFVLKRMLGDNYINFHNDVLNGVDNNRATVLGAIDDVEHKSNEFLIYRIK